MTTTVGRSVRRLDAVGKVTGTAAYGVDIRLPGMLHGALLRSPLPHGRIRRIDVSRARALRGVKDVVTGADTPGIKYGNWRLVPDSQDELALAVDKVRFIGDEVAAVCAVDRETAESALELIEVEYEELPAVFTVEEGRVVDMIDFPLQSEEPLDRLRLLRDQEVNTIICGGVQDVYEDLVRASGIRLISWVSGSVDDLLGLFLKGRLASGKRSGH